MHSSENANTRPGFFGFTTTRPVGILMIAIAVSLFGYVCYNRLLLNLMPEIAYPTITVRTEYPGAAPEEVEKLVTEPIEEALEVATNLVECRSVSRAGLSEVILEFSWDTDMNRVSLEVREKLDLLVLPEEAERPLLLRYDPTLDPVIRVALYGVDDLFRLREVAEEEIKRELEGLPGVAAVKVRGGFEEEILVAMDEKELTLRGLSIPQISNRLREENINLASGSIKEGATEYLVRTLSEFQTLKEIENLVMATIAGAEVRLKDIARVEKTNVEPEVITRVEGLPSVEIDFYKEADANIVAVAKSLKSRLFRREAPTGLEGFLGKLAALRGAGKAGKGGRGPGAAGPHPGWMRARKRTVEAILPEGMKLKMVSDPSRFIEESIEEVRNTAVYGGILAIIVLYFFLRNLKSTVIIGLAIPLSVLATFAPMYLFKVSLNIMSLGGLALGIGMLVDNSIVVLESIYRCRREGDSVVRAAVRGVEEVGGAVFASTLTTICVFFPIVFVRGVAGQVFGDQALTVVFSLLASLAVALFFIPMAASRHGFMGKEAEGGGEPTEGKGGAAEGGGKAAEDGGEPAHPGGRGLRGELAALVRLGKPPEIERIGAIRRKPWLFFLFPLHVGMLVVRLLLEVVWRLLFALGILIFRLLKYAALLVGGILYGLLWLPLKAFDAGFALLQRIYPRMLRKALGYRLIVICLAAGLLVYTFTALMDLGSELIPRVYQGEFDLRVALPIGTPLEKTDEVAREVEAVVRKVAGVELRSLSTVVGAEAAASRESDEGEHSARLTLTLTEGGNLREREERLLQRLRPRFALIPETKVKVAHPMLFTFKAPIEIQIRGPDMGVLADISRKLQARLAGLTEIKDVKSTLQRGNPEIQIRYDRERLAEYGLDIYQVATLIKQKVKGEVPTRFRLPGKKIDLLVRLDRSESDTIEKLRGLIVNPQGTVPIPLSAVADVVLSEGPAEIRRLGQQRAVLITGNLAGLDLARAVEKIQKASSGVRHDAAYSIELSGQNQEMQVSLESLFYALLLAVFLIYVVMASLFESLLHPFVILLTIPLALVGVIAILHHLGIPLSIVVYIGMIILAGIVVNNAIVLVDYINRLRRRGMEKTDAIVRASSIRLRPILMTTATTVLGLLPMALGLGEGAEIRTPMALAVISGLISSTVLTLVIVPVVYSVLPDFRGKGGDAGGKVRLQEEVAMAVAEGSPGKAALEEGAGKTIPERGVGKEDPGEGAGKAAPEKGTGKAGAGGET
jgi:HAE1 family hydrophobic/amphiphilic exporter-1